MAANLGDLASALGQFVRAQVQAFHLRPITDAQLREFWLQYDVAARAYQSCVLALNEAVTSDKGPTPELLTNEAAALRDLTEARGNLLEALAELADEPPF